MLISALIGGADVDSAEEEDCLKQIANLVVAKLKGDGLLNQAVELGLGIELIALYRRLCDPLKNAIERQFAALSGIGLAQWILRNLRSCPVLDRALYEQSCQLVHEFATAGHRYLLDQELLISNGLLRHGVELSSVRIASADKHHGQHVLRFAFVGHGDLYYKPRSGSGAALCGEVSRHLRHWGLPLVAPEALIREGYHWMAGVEYEEKIDSKAAKHFAFSGGVLYAVARVLNASDLHFENIIATKQGPVVVDCETMCQPRFSAAAAAYLLRRPREEHDDVTSLFLNFDHYGGQEIDYGGLSCVDVMFRADPNAGLQVELPWEQRSLRLHRSRSAVEVDGRRIAPAVEHFECFVDGIRHASECLLCHKDELIALISPEHIFRVPLRATRVYAAVLAERMAGICFSSYAPEAWRSHLEADLQEAPDGFAAAARTILDQESADLDALDIPAAYVRAGSRDLFVRNAVVPGVFDLSPLEVVRLRINELSPSAVDEQISALRARLEKATKQRLRRATSEEVSAS
ncbi:DUF4135 domain-containing protein [Methylibium rhizosphaerae]|uniref:DUF4135 domain-containing protein n=1 Tax=Methylibium rhizosphaerae TaxID=2570323 RepID=UPI00112708DB|nr:DUF4135 domain-containing protein [Methylibium rhizosphaerae]